MTSIGATCPAGDQSTNDASRRSAKGLAASPTTTDGVVTSTVLISSLLLRYPSPPDAPTRAAASVPPKNARLGGSSLSLLDQRTGSRPALIPFPSPPPTGGRRVPDGYIAGL